MLIKREETVEWTKKGNSKRNVGRKSQTPAEQKGAKPGE